MEQQLTPGKKPFEQHRSLSHWSNLDKSTGSTPSTSSKAITILPLSKPLEIVYPSNTNITATAVPNNQTDGLTHGWVSNYCGRGTSDILWSCFFTMFLCVWTAIHLPALYYRG